VSGVRVREEEVKTHVSNDNFNDSRTLSKEDQLNILYKYLIDNSINNVYEKEGYRKIEEKLNKKISKSTLQVRFQDLISLDWIKEIDIGKKYNLIKGEF
jgi:hypothetical protein